MIAFDKIDLLAQPKYAFLSLIRMNALRHQFSKSLLIIGSCLYLNSLLLAAPSKLESNSPFLPPGYSTLKPTLPKPVTQPNSPLARELEFRGVVQLNGTYHFSLFKKSENKGYWIPENGIEDGIEVSNFDADGMLITVTVNSRSEQLSLMTASENPLPVPTTSPSAPITNIPAPPTALFPSGAQAQKNTPNEPARRTIPRRRVILPPKN